MRYFLVLMLSLLTFPASAVQAARPAEESAGFRDFTTKVAALESKHGGRLGVAVLSDNGMSLFSYRANERFAMCSTFKALLAAAVLARVDAKQESLERPISYSASDLLEYAPITKEHLNDGHMTVAELSAATIQYSDNTAANLLLDTLGGPKALTAYLRSIGDSTTRLDRNEPSLNANLPNDPRDTSTPDAMAATLQKVLIGDRLSPASREQLKLWMFGNTTGDSKLRAGFDKFWLIGDKTGSGANGASNDVAIVFPRRLAPFVISVFYTGSGESGDEKNAVIAGVARITRGVLASQRPLLDHGGKPMPASTIIAEKPWSYVVFSNGNETLLTLMAGGVMEVDYTVRLGEDEVQRIRALPDTAP